MHFLFRQREEEAGSHREGQAYRRGGTGKQKVEIRAGRYRAKKYPKTTIEELCKRFQDWAKVSRRGADWKTHVPVIQEHFKGRLISTITSSEVEVFRKQRMDTDDDGEVQSPDPGA